MGIGVWPVVPLGGVKAEPSCSAGVSGRIPEGSANSEVGCSSSGSGG